MFFIWTILLHPFYKVLWVAPPLVPALKNENIDKKDIYKCVVAGKPKKSQKSDVISFIF